MKHVAAFLNDPCRGRFVSVQSSSMRPGSRQSRPFLCAPRISARQGKSTLVSKRPMQPAQRSQWPIWWHWRGRQRQPLPLGSHHGQPALDLVCVAWSFSAYPYQPWAHWMQGSAGSSKPRVEVGYEAGTARGHMVAAGRFCVCRSRFPKYIRR